MFVQGHQRHAFGRDGAAAAAGRTGVAAHPVDSAATRKPDAVQGGKAAEAAGLYVPPTEEKGNASHAYG